jgi:prophage DNA circulation protein
MEKAGAQEAAGIVQRMMSALMTTVPAAGRPGSAARAAIGDVSANAYVLLRADQLGPPINNAFILAREAGANYGQLETVRSVVDAETPVTLGAVLVQNVGIELCLATESEIIASMTFASRQDVEAVKQQIAVPFQDSIETAADDMDQATFQDLTALYGAVINHLVATARPLPRMIRYQFGSVHTTLTLAYRLYADASRAEEVRNENKIVHPAFAPREGVALSA